jgi:hypothetical protein
VGRPPPRWFFGPLAYCFLEQRIQLHQAEALHWLDLSGINLAPQLITVLMCVDSYQNLLCIFSLDLCFFCLFGNFRIGYSSSLTKPMASTSGRISYTTRAEPLSSPAQSRPSTVQRHLPHHRDI